jgi:peptidoglycan/xylan/chitin deacetylase (PgdA/CDA1 family)
VPRAMQGHARAGTVSAEHFASQARVLASLFAPVGPRAIESAFCGDAAADTAPYRVLVTFDDGVESMARHAWPILRRYGLPLVCFVVTGAAGTDAFLWTDEVTALVADTSAAALRVPFLGQEEIHPLGSMRARLRAAELLKLRLKHLDHLAYEEYLAKIRAAAGAVRLRHHEGTRFLDWEELRALAREGVEIGSHTRDHRILSRLPDELLMEDVAESQRVIAAQLGAPARLFAYPNGYAEDLDDRAVRAVGAAGFTHGFTMEMGIASGEDARLRLPRLAPSDEPGVMLGLVILRWMVGAVVAQPMRQGRARVAHLMRPLAAALAAPLAESPSAAPGPTAPSSATEEGSVVPLSAAGSLGC